MQRPNGPLTQTRQFGEVDLAVTLGGVDAQRTQHDGGIAIGVVDLGFGLLVDADGNAHGVAPWRGWCDTPMNALFD